MPGATALYLQIKNQSYGFGRVFVHNQMIFILWVFLIAVAGKASDSPAMAENRMAFNVSMVDWMIMRWHLLSEKHPLLV